MSDQKSFTWVRETTAAEERRITEAIARGMVEAIDNRSDGIPDSDFLGDPNRVGARIADGFALLGGE
jgi:hypothetical protein